MQRNLFIALFFFINLVYSYGASFVPMQKEIIRAEGTAFTITKFDKGGATKYGVTKATWFGWCGLPELKPCDRNKNGLRDDYDVALITLSDAFLIYKKGYWDTWRCDKIKNQEVAEMLCDWNINQGLGKERRYVKIVQKIIGLPEDGKISDQLINAINKTDPHNFLLQVTKKRLSLYQELIDKNPTQLKFKASWFNRTIYVLRKYEKINLIPFTYNWFSLSKSEQAKLKASRIKK